MKANIAFFVPHIGCPHRCSFCDQTAITGSKSIPRGDDVSRVVGEQSARLCAKGVDFEIAFFGGSFTAVPREYMLELLSAAAPFVKSKKADGIRISTRPDAINREILSVLKEYGVTSIELGAQSMDDSVLEKNLRGHTAADVENAAKMIKEAGFELGLQMMTGLYGSNADLDRMTASRIADLGPDCVRIYPAITLKNTLLGRLYRDGVYVPQTLEQAVDLCADLLRFFDGRKIPVIKLGLHASAEVERDRLAGPYHPAFRELCEGKIYLENALSVLSGKSGKYILYVRPDCISKAVGQGKRNLAELEKNHLSCRVRGREGLKIYEVLAEKERTDCF